ncbi:unnamed protein product [Camellia sinensis]
MDSLISTSLPIFTGELTFDFMAKDSYVLPSYHAWTFRLSDARKQLEQVLGLVESMASLICVDIDFNLDAQEVADDSGGRGSDVNVTKLNVVEIVETKIRNAKDEGDDTMKCLELEDLHMDDALLLSLDLPSKFLCFQSNPIQVFLGNCKEKERSKMAAPVVISAAQVILNNFIPLASEQIKLEWGFKEDLETLRRRLILIQSLLSDAENQRITSASMREWLKNLKLVTCDAENVLDEFAYEALRRKLEVKNRMRNKVRNLFSLSNPLAFRLKMAHKVKDINSMLDLICKEANDIGLKPADQLLNAASTNVKPRDLNFRLTHPFVDDSQVVGRDGDVSTMIDMLIGSYDSGDDLSIIAIVGMGGMGKTTLGQLVYKNKKVVKYFGDQRIWICVSNDFVVKRSLNEMVQSLTRNQCEMENIEGIVRMLQEKLYGKEYLLVLDDVWNEIADKWECMRNSLLGIGGSKGSKIIATTRRSSTRSFGFSSCVSAEFTACQQYNQLVQAINNRCREKRFEQEAINLTMNLPQHSTWRMESYYFACEAKRIILSIVLGHKDQVQHKICRQCPRPSTLKFVDIDKPICKWKTNRDSEFSITCEAKRIILFIVDNLMFIIGYLIQIKRNQECLENLQVPVEHAYDNDVTDYVQKEDVVTAYVSYAHFLVLFLYK